MSIPAELRYTSSHEWIRQEGGEIVIGITQHAQEQLGEVIYAGDFPEVGDEVGEGDVIAVVESVKAASDVYTPVAGRVVAVNEGLEENPGNVNQHPYGEGWMVRIATTADLGALLDAAGYTSHVENEGH